MFDNLIAGGQPVKISIKDNLYKEAFEEAGLESYQMHSIERVKLFTTFIMKTKN